MNKRKLSLRWFGSLTNLSIRRSSDKVKGSSALVHDGKPVGGKAGVGSQCVDDLEPRPLSPLSPLSPVSPSYARSSDMYTHVGTVPRSQRQKKSISRETNDKTIDWNHHGNQVAVAARLKGDHVRDSPLLGALSSLSLPTSKRPSPLTSQSYDDMKDEEEKVEEAGPTAADRPRAPPPSQDVYVLMDPVDEAAALRHQHVIENTERRRGITCSQEMENLANGEQEVGGRHSSKAAVDKGGEYVKFSKEKFWLETPTEELKKQLEAELQLSGANLRSHAWYHGHIPEEVSDSLVLNHGDFLVRDSQCTVGDFILTVHWDQKTLHLPIQRTAVGAGSSGQMAFRLDDHAFDSLPSLIHFLVGGRTTLTRWGGAQIQRPINRTLPLSYLETAFGATGPRPQEAGLPDSPSSIRHQRTDVSRQTQPPSDPSVSTLDKNTSPAPPSRSPSSSRTSSMAPSPSTSRRPPTLDPPTSDPDGGSCYTELYPGPQSYVERLRVEEGSAGDDQLRSVDGTLQFSPVVETTSAFRPSVYRSALMPGENKPLEVSVLRRVKELLADIDPQTAAKHITKADCTVARILEVSPEVQRMMGVTSGMELLTLPHGQQLRLDLLERFQTMATTLAVDVLGCTGTSEERAALLHKLIQIAAELKSNMGNMFGFAAVMRALELPQVSRLEQTWTTLRQRHTEGAILYEKTLRPFMKSLNDGRESCPLSNTTFPHILPLLFLLEKSTALGEGAEPWETVEASVDVVMFHLGAARTVAQLGGIYRTNAEAKLQDFQVQSDILELFQTDFQMRLLWGSRGAEEQQMLRFAKFDQVLSALSKRLEPPTRPH